MNDAHMDLLTSPGWSTYLEGDVVPWILSALTPPDFDSVLEIGPGPGLATDLLSAHTSRHVALEIDPHLAGALRERTYGSGIEVICADATSSSLDSGQFTAALCLTMIHHVPTRALQDQLFAEACRLLRPGGVLVGLDSLDSPPLRALHVDDTFVPLDLATLEIRLTSAGFGELVIEGWDPPLRPGAKVRFLARKPRLDQV